MFPSLRRCSLPPQKILKDLFGNAAKSSAVAQFNSYDAITKYDFKQRPEVLFAGRANVGKSSLLNAVLGKNIVRSSSKPGATKTLNFFAPGSVNRLEPQLYLVDGPGYGMRGRPEWGDMFSEYISQRATLCRVFVLTNIAHGLKESDKAVLKELDDVVMQTFGRPERTYPLSFQIVFTKLDCVKDPREGRRIMADIMKEVWQTAPACLPQPILTSATMGLDGSAKLGVESIRESIAEAAGFIVR